MSIHVYQSEHFERPFWWWLIFGFIVLGVLGLVVFGPAISRGGDGLVFGVSLIANIAMILLLFGGYVYWMITHDQRKVSLEIQSDGIAIGSVFKHRSELKGYLFEANKRTRTIKNIVLLTDHSHHIYTLIDVDEVSLGKLTEVLNQHIPFVNTYEQTFMERVMRKMMV